MRRFVPSGQSRGCSPLKLLILTMKRSIQKHCISRLLSVKKKNKNISTQNNELAPQARIMNHFSTFPDPCQQTICFKYNYCATMLSQKISNHNMLVIYGNIKPVLISKRWLEMPVRHQVISVPEYPIHAFTAVASLHGSPHR